MRGHSQMQGNMMQRGGLREENSEFSQETQMPDEKNIGNIEEIELTDEQLTLMLETLASYNAESLTEEDAIIIVETFEEAQIHPSHAFAEAISDAGFDAQEIGNLAGIEAGGHPPMDFMG